MQYSNGFDLDAVLPVLKGRVGWYSDSSAKRNFESFHALCSEANLRAVQPTEGISDEAFTTYKGKLEDQVIQRVLSSVFSLSESLETVLLHSRFPGTTRQSIPNDGKFAGLQIRVVPDVRIAQKVNSVTLLFDGVATFDLYLFQDGTDEPVKTQSVTTVANKPTVIDLTDWFLSYGSTQATTFFIGYNQDDLGSVKAIRENIRYNRTNQFCATSFQSDSLSATTFEQSQISYNYDHCGLNAQVVSFRDNTSLIKAQPWLFDEAIGLQMVYFLLEAIVSTTRVSDTVRALQGAHAGIELKHYLYGAIPAQGVVKTKGLNEMLQEKYSEIRQAFYPNPKLSVVCLS